jgi:di/tricarboxylate transporter
MGIAILQMAFTFAVIAVAVTLFALERVRIEVTCIGVIVALLVFFHFFPVAGPLGSNRLSPEVILGGLANPSLIAILALLVVGQGLFHTGALEGPARALAERGAGNVKQTLTVLLVIAGVVSAFLNNTPVVVMFIPVVAAIAARIRMSPSKALMPISFICILGGMTTLIGSSTNLLVAGVAERMGQPPIGFFDFALPGLALAGVGALYVIFVMPRLLAPRATMAEEVTGLGGKQYIAQILITPDHPLAGITSTAGLFPELKDMTVRMIQRGEHPFLPPFENVTLRTGDVVIVAATRNVITEALKGRERIMTAVQADGGNDEGSRETSQLMLAEAVVAPGSRMIGRTIEQSGLHTDTGCIVMGIQRRSRMIRTPMSDIRMEAGDVILVIGTSEQIRRLRFNRDVLLLEWSAAELPQTAYAHRALAIFAGVIVAAASGLVPIVIAALAGALAMVPAGCLNIRQATRAFDQRIYLLVGAALAMAAALEATGGAAFLADVLLAALDGASPAIILSALFALIALLTNVLTNNAAAVLFTPIAIGVAARLGVDPFVFVVAVIFASNCSFATPFAYQTNLLVMGPGHYRFVDFVRAGGPLVIVLWLAFSIFAPWYFGL